jgi:hypothetical protein
VCTHAVRAAVWRSVVAITELFWWDVVDLGQRWRRWENEGNLIDETNYVITGGGNCQQHRSYIINNLGLRAV